ncbi:MAG: bifunctional phosphopantothenoylcysteine decarboxylase/phosphopantothenate--cysteine ligase CoaBC [Acidobacteria bacterium]|nr:MAG: bifunctional phosphopantothenoylcysteine decarboxylase/phosphopantothenate--cysteine ligase CoaBC [Acidobacteriota bacterium]
MNVVLGVTGCIGAYKAAIILRLLQKSGFQVYPVMTAHAQEFISALTLEKLSGHVVVTDLFQDHNTSIEHISVARAGDLLLVAPATANILAKFAHGIADDFLSTLYVSTTSPTMVAPAMNVEMWRHPATQNNVGILRERGVHIVEPESGYLACGEVGEGRLAEPDLIVREVERVLRAPQTLKGRNVLVTAGPTIEDLDPVRFVSNRSSGKMGYAIAEEAERRGASVVLVSGPTHLPPPARLEFVPVRSAREMAAAVFDRFPAVDVVVMAAAVSDYQPAEFVDQKIKKECQTLQLSLVPTPDILRTLGERKQSQILVGFAAETTSLREYALRKFDEKRLDLIVANNVAGPDAPFGSDSNRVVFLTRDNEEQLPLLSKKEVAGRLWDRIQSLVNLNSR